MTAVLAKTTFNDLQALNTRMNGHDNLDIIYKRSKEFLKATNPKF